MLLQVLYLFLCSAGLIAALPTKDIELRSSDTSLNFSSYAPVEVECPDMKKWVRPATGLSSEELAWVIGRKKKALKAMSSYLDRLNLVDFDKKKYMKKLSSDPSYAPTIGMAISGGGWAPALTVTGPLLAFDDRYEDSRTQSVQESWIKEDAY